MKIIRTTSTVLAAAALVLALTIDSHAAKIEKSRSTVSIARAVVAGPLQGGKDEFSVLVEAFAFDLDGDRGASLAADAFFGSIECTTLETDVDVMFSGLARAKAVGSVSGECVDIDTGDSSAYEAELKVVWRATGPPTKDRFTELLGGEICSRKVSSRPPTASGSFVWSAPGLGLSGSATSIVATELYELRDRCPA
jgi:hypothetical protein